MLTATPKVGDHVVVVYTKDRDQSSRPCRQNLSWKIEKISTKYLWVAGNKFEFNGRGVDCASDYELFDSEEAYDRHLQRDRSITKIKKATSAWSFGDGLSDEDLEQIVKLIEVK